MGKVISVNIPKGGVGKTTLVCSVAYLLSTVHKKRVLVIDWDSQGNSTYICLNESPYMYSGRTVLEAVKENQPRKYIVPVFENLDILTANGHLGNLPRFLYSVQCRTKPLFALKELLKDLRHEYDYILIDNPPALGDFPLNSLMAADSCIIPVHSEDLGFQAIQPMMEQIEEAKAGGNPSLVNMGIVVNIVLKARRKENESFLKGVDMYFPNIRMKSVIERTTDASRISKHGLRVERKMRKAVKQYEPLVKEILYYG